MIDLFQELAGKKGEVMAVAALRYLLMRNRPLREQFLKTLGTSVSYTLYQDFSYFGCELERSCWPDQDTDASPGRLDMLVESNTAVVGIEAKLGHQIRAEQIKKYLPELARRQTLLAKLHGEPVEQHMILLVPQWQKKDAEAAIATVKGTLAGETSPSNGQYQPDSLQVITWDDIINNLKSAYDDAAITCEDKFVLNTLESYIHYWTGQIANFDLLWKAAYNEYKIGNPMPQRELIEHLRQFFNTGDSNLGANAKYHIGYSFSPDFTDDQDSVSWKNIRWGWFGFIHQSILAKYIDNAPASAFCLFTDYLPDSHDNIHFKHVPNDQLRNDLKKWLYRDDESRGKHLWILSQSAATDIKLEKPESWQMILRPFITHKNTS